MNDMVGASTKCLETLEPKTLQLLGLSLPGVRYWLRGPYRWCFDLYKNVVTSANPTSRTSPGPPPPAIGGPSP
jgi:hypothetical protein